MMQVTKLQRKALEEYRQFRRREPSLIGLMRSALKLHVLMVLVGAAVAVLVTAIGQKETGLIVIGMVLGAVIRDYGIFRRFTKLWPALSETMNWRRIDELLGYASDDSA